jgi:hypothetical protein
MKSMKKKKGVKALDSSTPTKPVLVNDWNMWEQPINAGVGIGTVECEVTVSFRLYGPAKRVFRGIGIGSTYEIARVNAYSNLTILLARLVVSAGVKISPE